MRPLLRITLVLALAASLPISAAAAGIELEGVPNFHRVNDHVFRGGQPSRIGFENLAKLGVKTVVDLRRDKEHSTAGEAAVVEALGMRYVNVPMHGMKTPRSNQLSEVLELLESGEGVFVHCKHGKDRTGTVIGVYRIRYEGWTNERALEEAESCGIHWYHRGMKRLIRTYAVTDSARQGEGALSQ